MVWLDTQARATRFLIRTPLLFRERGDTEWRHAWTVNLSQSGVLFTTDAAVPSVGRDVEFVLALPVHHRDDPVEVLCTGRVVRIAASALDTGTRCIGMTIESHSFPRGRSTAQEGV